MKKFIFAFAASFILLLSGAAITSCIINDSEPEDLPVPSLQYTYDNNNVKNGFSFAFSPITNMKYANIIRESCPFNEEFKVAENISTRNIGQIDPADLTKLPTSFNFFDMHTENGGFDYRYYVRYFDGSNYYKTKYTTIKTGCGKGEAKLNVSNPILDYIWNEQTEKYVLQLSTKVIVPDGFTEVAVIIDNGKIIRPFTIGLVELATDENGFHYVAKYLNEDGTTTDSFIDLQKKLSADFLDTEIVIRGLIGIRKTLEENEDSLYTSYYWTLPVDGTVKIKKTVATGDPETVDDNSSFIVPSIKNPENGFDFSANKINLAVE